MKFSELRIGNYIIYNHRYCSVESISKEQVTLKIIGVGTIECCKDETKIEPIQIRPTHLFNFERKEDGYKFEKKTINGKDSESWHILCVFQINGVIVQITHDLYCTFNTMFFNETIIRNKEYQYCNKLHSIHQFQNALIDMGFEIDLFESFLDE